MILSAGQKNIFGPEVMEGRMEENRDYGSNVSKRSDGEQRRTNRNRRQKIEIK